MVNQNITLLQNMSIKKKAWKKKYHEKEKKFKKKT